ncbi:hypothetical protein [Streptomyces viridochromogenes]|uniref:Secreted protein n=1 Tax=Streptomyces viridochromogenes Tue57 TaxID=1160705 RepID=L8P6Y1_STRVR|nr:hypothetical protein [Streptomyces viridochromogenes]ELS51913.1 hypothetical protein STVIR_7139 [Streptomyces viridochromogenes Tue57]
MSRALPKYNKRRVTFIGGAAAVALSGTVIAGFALAGETSKSNAPSARTLASPGTITCPDVRSKLPAVPASARAEVDRNLALLNTQIREANQRLVNTVGQGGPNFVRNAILGPLKDKRVATVSRIATAIGRTAAKPQGLDALAPCTLNAAGTNAGGGAKATPSAPAQQAGGNTGNAGNGGNAGGAGRISCPEVRSKLPAVPASARAEVDRNLAQLDTQIREANQRLVNTVGQGGPNFVRNAILGPLKDKRVAALNRIETAIGRAAAKPEGLEAFATCTLSR